ncbi:hypothetical protein BJ875DRAFT_367973 [Amylocarpus encephaloides]|uniref:C2H2-type domain-containing protein n=1 Tax=Amylocarpus encephaloides TaxID=45428 RepID=A0A9P8C924_9HELO|nr:hypothetical protein BJ875DRAFT_367973 [Amylocarpus encephaloides]
MDIPHRPGARPSGLPEIFVHDSNSNDRFRNFSRSSAHNPPSASPAIAMSIKGSREPVPPPLPPPREMADIASGGNNGPDLAWKFANSRSNDESLVSSVAYESSLYGGGFANWRSTMDDRPDYSRRTSSTTQAIRLSQGDAHGHTYPRDEGSETSIMPIRSKYQDSKFSKAFSSSALYAYESNAAAYDKSLLQKLDARRSGDNTTPPRNYSKSAFSSSASDASPSRNNAEHRHPSQLKPLSLPILSCRPGLGFTESPVALPSRYEDGSSAKSPGRPFPRIGGLQTQFDHRSPSDGESDRSPLPYGDDTSRDSYDPRISPEDGGFHMDERLQIEDYSGRTDPYSPSATIGQKRRASSPPVDDGPSLHTVGSQSDLFRRRESASRCSPTPRLHSTSGSVSSTTSAPRANSYASSTLSITPSSMSSLSSSYGRPSPGGFSPGGLESADSPYIASLSLNPSPRGSTSRTNHQRNISAETRPLLSSRKLSDGMGACKSHGTPKFPDMFKCECCPKKPKAFDCQEDLDAHEQEKQYQCAYCNNRFKNKNEAERHQNSLHLRKHSWSCAALSGYPAAFFISGICPNQADNCGYCGQDFPRSGLSLPSAAGPQIPVATDRDWDLRIAHLQEMHKFGECNHAKKFFRADHFRQHLKHSHAGTSGKWTNILENACMKDEPLPEPIRAPERVSPGGIRVARISEEDEML